jgi:hypothetical protein
MMNRSSPDPDYGSYGCPIDDLPAPAVYSYDDAGNRNALGDTLGAGDRLRTARNGFFASAYTYDDDGNVLTRSITGFGYNWAYDWSSDNRLLRAVYPLTGIQPSRALTTMPSADRS